MAIVPFLITVVVLAISLFVVSKLPLGVDIDSPGAALLGGAIIGALSGIYHFLPSGFRAATGWLSLGLIPLVGAVIVFGLAAWLVEGFRLRWGILSAFLGAIALAIVNSILTSILTAVNLLPA